jgi:hypothetical protein
MQDNFDLKGYLRHGNKLLNEGVGGYFDLKPINYLGEGLKYKDTVNVDGKDYFVVATDEDNEFDPEEVAAKIKNFDPNDFVVLSDKDPDTFSAQDLSAGDLIANQKYYVIKKRSELPGQMEEEYFNEDDGFIQAQRDAVGAKGSGMYGVDNENDVVTIDLDMAWDADEEDAVNAVFDRYGIEVTQLDTNPGTFEVTGRKEDVLAYLRSEFYDMDEESIAEYYPELLDGELDELEKPEKIYADDDDEFGSYQDRIMGLGGDRIESGIISLLDDGFEAEDVMDFCKMIIDAHSQGKKY